MDLAHCRPLLSGIGLLALALGYAATGLAGEDGGSDTPPQDSGWSLLLFPPAPLYEQYTADPHALSFAVLRMSYSDSEIPDSASSAPPAVSS